MKQNLNHVKNVFLLFCFLTFLPFSASAEDGHQLWLRYQPVNKAKVTGPECIAAQELRTYSCQDVVLTLDAAMEQDAYRISDGVITAKDEIGLLYGAYELLRRQGRSLDCARDDKGGARDDIFSKPFYKLRILNHWDNLNGTIERGYAGLSIFWKGKDSGKRG